MHDTVSYPRSTTSTYVFVSTPFCKHDVFSTTSKHAVSCRPRSWAVWADPMKVTVQNIASDRGTTVKFEHESQLSCSNFVLATRHTMTGLKSPTGSTSNTSKTYKSWQDIAEKCLTTNVWEEKAKECRARRTLYFQICMKVVFVVE